MQELPVVFKSWNFQMRLLVLRSVKNQFCPNILWLQKNNLACLQIFQEPK